MEKGNHTATPHISLEQWRCLVAVVDAGGYAQASERLHKSQSSVSYAVQKLESVLNIKAFSIAGRRAVLTPAGEMLYRRAKVLLDEAASLERAAHKASAGWESEIAIAVETLFPIWLLLDCLDQFGAESPQTRIELHETVLGGAPESLQEGRVDLAISPYIPPGFSGEPLPRQARIIPVAHPDHPLHQLKRELTLRDLRKHRHLIVRDSGSQRDKKALTVEVEQRWALSSMATSIGAACRGYGFAWLPEDKIRSELEAGILKPLSLRGGGERYVQMYLIFADRDAAGPGALRLAEILQEQMAASCPDHR
ncbi:LysR family transcriptional regulator [Microbulbifer rhizosphaerae]|uniref:DNA-binding transcriptional LysR family regulator n=1 Tax=Microbulbifer rhizosphaerae TaxID=1562603 RepID=A0A7W4Z7V8_9GAMM|nr:LysR family transcriptional regulator [Microbulbifer rhizosphaerae]MBB3060163.1 DNA-binding transcriptional LysR family regulator [Microbulbifer rhizosphaerae]